MKFINICHIVLSILALVCRLIQSATEIAAIVNPYVAILDVFKHRSKYSGNGEDVVSYSNIIESFVFTINQNTFNHS